MIAIKHIQYPVGQGGLHTGDACLKSDFAICGLFRHYGLSLKYTRFAQIPHHGSINNHSKIFALPFCSCVLYYTSQAICNAKIKVDDIILSKDQKIWEVSDDYATIINVP